MTTKFKPGDRVRAYDRDLFNNGKYSGSGTLAHQQSENWALVSLDDTGHTIGFHPKQLRRLKKKKRVVWESTYPIGTNDVGDGIFRLSDEVLLEKFSLSKFIGKRVRIEITEAKEK